MRFVAGAWVTLATLIGQADLTPALGQSLAGEWKGSATCDQQYMHPAPWPLTLIVTHESGNRYSVKASTPNTAGIGTIDGTRVSFTASNLLNQARHTGSVSGNTMSGTYTQSLNPVLCRWSVAKIGGTPLAGTPASTPRASSQRPDNEQDGPCGGIVSTATTPGYGNRGERVQLPCIAVANKCGYRIQMRVQVSGVSFVQATPVDAGRSEKICASRPEQTVRYLGWHRWGSAPGR